MKYKITIQQERPDSPNSSGYRNWDEIYEQVVDKIDIPKLVSAVQEQQVAYEEINQ